MVISYPTGSMTADGGTKTTSGGNTIHTFTTSGSFTVTSLTPSALTTGTYALPVTGLSQGTLYYYRGYAVNATGTGYTSDATLTMSGYPTLTTPTSASPTTTTATLGANITSAGSPATITERGVCYGTSPMPSTTCVSEPLNPGIVKALVVAGGGAGGGAMGGGGGAGCQAELFRPSSLLWLRGPSPLSCLPTVESSYTHLLDIV